MNFILGNVDCNFDDMNSEGCQQWDMGKFVITHAKPILKSGPTGDASLNGEIYFTLQTPLEVLVTVKPLYGGYNHFTEKVPDIEISAT